MRYLDDALVRRLVPLDAAVEAIEDAFRGLADGTAALQARVRTSASGTKLSTMGAVWDSGGVVGAKVYTTTPRGRFRFVVVLFDSDDGTPIALLDADGLTAIRTAATSVVAARHLARPEAAVLTIFGAGIQADAHLDAFHASRHLEDVRIVNHRPVERFVADASERTGLPVRQVTDAADALRDAGLIVTTTRATTPLFDGRDVDDGAHVTAVGATRPGVRELDDTLLARAGTVVVEWLPQAQQEAGDLIGAVAAGAFSWDRAVELAEVVSGRVTGRTTATAITVFESVGVGLEDVAVAATVLRAAEADGLGRELP
ncbi:MAG: ornithine cyclodeaminase family protein [Actinobacteria bacterium]|nr:ornithine cyclodeaminase family protein [Actinomycetota bacterium]